MGIDYPNPEWGYGRLDIEGIFRFIESVLNSKIELFKLWLAKL